MYLFLFLIAGFVIVNLVICARGMYKRKVTQTKYKNLHKDFNVPYGAEARCFEIGRTACRSGVLYWVGNEYYPESMWWSRGWMHENTTRQEWLTALAVSGYNPYGTEPPEGMWEPEEHGILKKLKG